MDKVHFGHVCFAAATMTGMTTFASIMGHIESAAILPAIGTALGIVILAPLYASFK